MDSGAILLPMDVMKMLADLRAQRDQLNEAILALTRLAAGGAKRRGRPPAWLQQAATARATVTAAAGSTAKGKRPRKQRKPFSAATRKKMAAKKAG